MKKVYILLVIILLLAAVSVISFYLSKDFRILIGFECRRMNEEKTFCVDKMPDFPEKIGDYELTQYNKANWHRSCETATLCVKSISLRYYNTKGKNMIEIAPIIFEEGNEAEIKVALSAFFGTEIIPGVFEVLEDSGEEYNGEVIWNSKKIDAIGARQYTYKDEADGDRSFSSVPDNGLLIENGVFNFFYNKYPPVVD